MKGSILLKKPEERTLLDRKNQEILQALVDNSRVSITNIAKKIKLSKPAILQRISQLNKKEIILQHIAYYNVRAFNHLCYMIMLEVDPSKKDIVIEKLRKCEFSAAIIKLASNFNIFWMVYSKDNNHFNSLIKAGGFSKHIKNIQIHPICKNYFDSYKLFNDEKKSVSQIGYQDYELDKNDLDILKTLKENSRISLVEISKKIDLTAEAIKQRMDKLQRYMVILKLFTNFDVFRIGFQPYLIFLKTNRERQDETLDFIRRYKHSNGQYVLDGSFDLSCFLVVKSILELREFIDSLTKTFSRDIIEYQTYLITDQILSDFLPDGVYNDLIKRL